ncbi:MAG: hypothetical protein AMXMBFR23_03230 [Chloroflexota bacterium]
MASKRRRGPRIRLGKTLRAVNRDVNATVRAVTRPVRRLVR